MYPLKDPFTKSHMFVGLLQPHVEPDVVLRL